SAGTYGGAGNIIAFNKGAGVGIDSGSGDTVLGDPIFANGSLGILSSPGSNNSITPPVIASVSTTGSQTTVQGTFTGAAGTQYLIEVFSSPSSAAGPGQTPQGFALATTDATGDASFTFRT